MPPSPLSAPLGVLVVTETTSTPDFLAELARSPLYRPLGRVTDAAAGLRAVRQRGPDVVVADIVTLDRVRELSAMAEDGGAALVVVSSLAPELGLLACMAAGARAFVRKPVEAGLLDQAIVAATSGWTFVDPRTTGWLVELVLHGHLATGENGLSLRQSQVLLLVRNGLTNKEIAAVLGLSAETVKCHLQEAMRKLGARDRREAAARVDDHGLPT